MLLDFIIKKRECAHSKVPIDVKEAYCPDCGELVKNTWFLVRCSCCDIKRGAHSKYNEIVPNTKYCPNCGCTDYYIQELDNINFIDVNYAVYKKVIIPQQTFTSRQVWIEKETNLIMENKLLELGK